MLWDNALNSLLCFFRFVCVQSKTKEHNKFGRKNEADKILGETHVEHESIAYLTAVFPSLSCSRSHRIYIQYYSITQHYKKKGWALGESMEFRKIKWNGTRALGRVVYRQEWQKETCHFSRELHFNIFSALSLSFCITFTFHILFHREFGRWCGRSLFFYDKFSWE